MGFDFDGLKDYFYKELKARDVSGNKEKLHQLAEFVEDYINQFDSISKKRKKELIEQFFKINFYYYISDKKIEIKTI